MPDESRVECAKLILNNQSVHDKVRDLYRRRDVDRE